MKYSIPCATLIASLFLSIPLTASPLEDKVQAFKKALKDEITVEPAKDEPTPSTKRWRPLMPIPAR